MKSVIMYVRLMRYIDPRWALTVLAFLMTILYISFSLVQPYLISHFIDKVLIDRQIDLAVPLLGISLACTAAYALLKIAGFSIFRFLEMKHTLDLRDRVLEHIRKIPLSEIEKHGSGKFMALMGMDTTKTAKFINVTAVELIKQWLQMLISLIIIFAMDWRLGLIALTGIPIMMGIPRLYRKPIKEAVNKLRHHNEEIGTYLYESLQGSREIRAYGLESWERQRNETMYRDLVKVSIREGLFRVGAGETAAVMIAITVVLLYGFGSGQVLSGALTVGMMVASVRYIQSVLSPVQNMNYLISDLLGSEVAMSRIEEFLQSPIETASRSSEGDQEKDHSEIVLPYTKEHEPLLWCKDLFVSYEGTCIINGIDIQVRKGQLAAFIGTSGSGKSTLFKTLQGFMSFDSGQLVLGSIPIEKWPRRALSRYISYVSQDTFLFKGTLFENVLLGKLDATEQEVYEILCEVDLKSYVDQLPDGMHTHIDNQGFQLSGGQRQRVAIARAIIRKPEILILDEPTSALDRGTEDQVMTTIKRIMANKTTLISTHKLETVLHADVIYVMDQGTIVDFGTHDVLAERCSPYIKLLKSQELQTKAVQVS
jgi:ABC-type multidrug transport system fused ATPase/permease subunit